VVIVGGVAGGMSTATRLRRLDADVTITVLERSGHVSFANCGLPYFVGGLIEEEEDLTLQTPESLFDRFRLDVRVNQEVVAIDRKARTVRTRSTVSGEEGVVAYDRLVLSMGAAPVRSPIPGYDRVRTLRTVEDAAHLAMEVDIAPTTAVQPRVSPYCQTAGCGISHHGARLARNDPAGTAPAMVPAMRHSAPRRRRRSG